MELFFRQYGEPGAAEPPVILLHGLFGSLVNWHRVAGALAEERWVVVPDLRNHGRSPHGPDVSYPAMAADLRELMDRLEIGSANLVGHSMGGKVAMWLALTQSARVAGLVPVDMAPVKYPNQFGVILTALSNLPLGRISSRKEADVLLSGTIEPKALRDYLLQNLVKEGQHWRWRNNIEALQQGMDSITGFPQTSSLQPYVGPAYFVYGSESDYVRTEHENEIFRLFPNAEMYGIEGAGHWVYAEQPSEFTRIIKSVLFSS